MLDNTLRDTPTPSEREPIQVTKGSIIGYRFTVGSRIYYRAN